MGLKETLQETIENEEEKFIKTKIPGFGETEIIVDSTMTAHFITEYREVKSDSDYEEKEQELEEKYDFIVNADLVLASKSEDKLTFEVKDFKW